MKYTNGKRGLLQAVALAQVLLLVVAGCKSSSDNATEGTRQDLSSKDGDLTVAVLGTIVNGYSKLTVDAAAGATTVTVNAMADFTAPIGPGTRPALGPGDLVLIIQMAGASIDPNDTVNYGTVTNLNNAGNYELSTVASIAGSAITLTCALKNSYTAAGKAQVIRVPQYANLTIDNGASITAPAWDGTVGGVVAVQAATTLQINATGAINVSEMGFHGGLPHAGGGLAAVDVTTYRSALLANGREGGEKGEGIAGWPNHDSATAYPYPYGRGAPANAGGGGNWHNAGGGGGANAAASGSTWTGEGVMLTTAQGVVGGTLAWPLDPSYAGGFANSPGGGRGGYTYSNPPNPPPPLPDPTLANGTPGLAAWAGNDRRERGGLGGRPLTSSPAGKLFMGGGGGAGDENDGKEIQGGRGGGLVFVIAGAVTGAGKIQANGAVGGAATSAAGASGDGPGGGGGGGTVVVQAAALSDISIEAKGGPGGNQAVNYLNEAEGPGGGGGGGYIAVSGGTPVSALATGGLGGTTTSATLNKFPSNGATAGHDGVTNGDATTILYCLASTDAGVDAQSPEAGIEVGAKDATPDVQAIDGPVVLQDAGTPDASVDASPKLDSSDATVVFLDASVDTSPSLDSSDAIVVFLDARGDASPGLDSTDATVIDGPATIVDAPAIIVDAPATIADAPAIIVDAPAIIVDAPATIVDGPGPIIYLDAAADVAALVDLAPVGGEDAPPVGNMDAAEDATATDAEALLDAVIEGGDASLHDAQVTVRLDAAPRDVFTAPDQAVLPPDTAMAADGPASTGSRPDAEGINSLRVMGSGFCAVNPMHDSAPGLFTFFLVAGFGLLLRRRRR